MVVIDLAKIRWEVTVMTEHRGYRRILAQLIEERAELARAYEQRHAQLEKELAPLKRDVDEQDQAIQAILALLNGQPSIDAGEAQEEPGGLPMAGTPDEPPDPPRPHTPAVSRNPFARNTLKWHCFDIVQGWIAAGEIQPDETFHYARVYRQLVKTHPTVEHKVLTQNKVYDVCRYTPKGFTDHGGGRFTLLWDEPN